MKHVAPILLLAVLACDSASSDHVSPSMPPAATQPSVAAVPLGVELFSDEFCKGGNAWWNARFNIFGAGSLEGSEIRVYTIDAFGERKLFGVAKTGVPELEGTDFSFYAEGIAPADSIPDLHDAGYPANYGFVPFGFDVYAGPHHELVGTASQYSDIPLTSNLYPHACQGIKSRTGCLFVCCPTNASSSDYQVGGDWFWQIGGDFITGPCTNPTLRLKVYFIAPGGKQVLFAFGEADAIDEFGGHRFVLVGKAPALELGALPGQWLAKFLIEVSSNGTPVGRFDFEAPGPLTPNPRPRSTHTSL
jgi:hypothetical protein